VWQRLRELVRHRWIYRDAHYLVVDLELDAARAKRWVSWPLELASPARGQLFLSYFPTTTFGSVYREAGVFFDVTHFGRRAAFSPWMLVDDDVALILGRELLGYPKKLGEFTFELDGDRISATASRRGHPLVSMRGTLGDVVPKPPPILARPHRNIRASTGLAIPKVIAFTPTERVIEVRGAQLEVTITGSERDPLDDLGLGRVLAARLHRVDLGGSMPPIPVGVISPIAYAKYLLMRSH
jgi:acetoacetate decarboxylase